MHTTLQGIAKKAKRSKKHRFKDLCGMLDVTNLRHMFFKLKKKAAPGVDRKDFDAYKMNLEENLQDLVQRLKNGNYHAKLVRRAYIPKPPNGKRPLGIPVIEDKLLQVAVSKILMAIYEQDFLKCSFAYREGIGPLDAVRDLNLDLQYGSFGWVVEADIKGFFCNMDHNWMVRMLEERIHDKRFIRLIKKWLKAGILETDGKITHPVTGTPQGGNVSSVLANIYLHYALDLWFDKKVKPNCQGYAKLVRFSDDFVCAFQYKEDAFRFYQTLGKRLGKFGLEVSKEKTRTLRFSRFELESNEAFDFLGFEFRWIKDRQGKARIQRRTATKRFKASLRNLTTWMKENAQKKISNFMEKLASKFRGYWNYYGVRGNSKRLGSFWREGIQIVYKWLNRRSQRKSYNWTTFKEVLKAFKVPSPKIVEGPAERGFAFTCC